MKISSVSEMRAMDRQAIGQLGIPEEILMENAGLASYRVLEQEIGIAGRRFTVVCGVGNNGGDGFVAARKILSNEGQVKVFIVGDPSRFKGAAKKHLDILKTFSAEIICVASLKKIRSDIQHAHGIVDALLGTGLDREVAGLHREVIRLLNESGRPVLSLDIPSGIHGDTGQVLGEAVRANWTVTFGLPKLGNMLYPGYEHCGQLYVSHISFPPALYKDKTIKTEINHPPPLPPRKKTAHKGSVGDVLIIAGASGYIGAPFFSAYAFMKAGGGYVRLAAPRSIAPLIAQKACEIVLVPQQETVTGAIALKNRDALATLANEVDMVVIGPGLSLDQETRTLVKELAEIIKKPLIIDGDGLTAIAEDMEIIRKRKAPTVLTPHPGEMSRLVGRTTAEIDVGKIDIVRETAADLQAIVVLKGAHSLIGYPDERVFINLTGNAGMATAGSGDVLTGTIAAMTGLGLPVADAVRKGVFIHGLAGDLAAKNIGEDGITARDILDYLPRAVMLDRSGTMDDDELKRACELIRVL